MSEENVIVYPENLRMSIGIEGVSCLKFSSCKDKRILASGTTGGRIRILDCSNELTKELYRKQWHKSINCLDFYPISSNYLVSASNQSAIKVHCIETGQRSWSNLKAHLKTPITALICIEDSRWISGDERGIVKFWDARQSTEAFTIEPEPDDQGNFPNLDKELFAINDLAIGYDRHGFLLAARDDGALVTYNIRRRRHEMTSDTIAYSARSVEIIKNGKKVLVGTDEGVINVFNWNEFGNICDRFPVRKARAERNMKKIKSGLEDWPAIENIIKVNEDIAIAGTDDGVVTAISILPNRILDAIGQHICDEDAEDENLLIGTGVLAVGGGDCMALAVSTDQNILASGLPLSSRIDFYPINHLSELAELEEEQLSLPKRQRECSMKKKTQKAKIKCIVRDVKHEQNRKDFMSGLFEDVNERSETEQFTNTDSSSS